MEVEETRNIANVRIHVERVIGAVRQKYSILRGTLPVDFLIKKQEDTSPQVDKIVRVAWKKHTARDTSSGLFNQKTRRYFPTG